MSPECCKSPLVPDISASLGRTMWKKGTRATSHGCPSPPPLSLQTLLTQHSCCQTYLTPAAELTQPHPVPAPESGQLESNLEAIHHSWLSSRMHSSGNTFQTGRLEYDWRRERQWEDDGGGGRWGKWLSERVIYRRTSKIDVWLEKIDESRGWRCMDLLESGIGTKGSK